MTIFNDWKRVDFSEHDNIGKIIDEWETPIRLHSTDNIYKLLEVIVSEYERVDEQVAKIEKNKFIAGATGKELEKVGELVGVKRKENEGDEKLRKRIKGAFAAQASDSTYEMFTRVALSILETNTNAVTFKTPPETAAKIVRLKLDASVIENSPLTLNELITLLNGSLSIDATAEIEIKGTFAFAGGNSNAVQEGWDVGTWSSIQREQ